MDGKESRSDRLVVYSAGPRGLAESVVAAFTEETGIEVDLFQSTTGQIMARLEAERYRPRADVVVFASEVAAAALKSEDRLLAHIPPTAPLLWEGWSDPEGFYHATSASLVGVAISASVENAPATWNAWLTDPGDLRVVMPSPSRSGAAGDFTVGYLVTFEDGLDDFLAARSLGMDFAAANSQAIGSLLMGAHNAILGAADYLIYRQIERGENIRMEFPEEGAVLVTRPIAILASTRNLEGAKAFVDFYFELEAQQMVAATHLLPGRTDIPPSAVRGAELPALIHVDADTALRRQSTLLRRFQVQVERAVVPREARR